VIEKTEPDGAGRHRCSEIAGVHLTLSRKSEPMELLPEGDTTTDRPPPEIEVRKVEAPNVGAWCFVCGQPIDSQPGPGLFLKGGWERVCKTCARSYNPAALNELKWRRRDWESENGWSR
jgi:hypothetical protein